MRSADLTPVARDVLKLPATFGVIFFSMLAAYVLDVLPWSGAWLLARPDFVLVVLLFWAINEPRAVGQGAAFFVGLLMDVSDSMLLGQHAFAYVLAVFAAQIFRVRILSFHLPEQTLHMFGPTFVASCMMLALNLLLGADFPGFMYFVSPAITALLWAPLTAILHSSRLRRRRREAAT